MATKAELIAEIDARTVGALPTPSVVETLPNGGKRYAVLAVERTPEGVKAARSVEFYVFNEGVVAGPQVYAEDVYDDSDPPVLIHSAGDPIMDDQDPPQQVVIAPEDAEQAFFVRKPDSKPDFYAQAQTWLENNLPNAIKYFEITQVDEAQEVAFVRAIKSVSGNSSWIDVFVWRESGTVSYEEIV